MNPRVNLAAGVGAGFSGISVFGSPVLTEVAHAMAQGVAQGGLAEATGGEFEAGFLSAVAGASMRVVSSPFNINTVTGLAASAIVGGTVSEIGGGKFANGAMTASFVFLFSEGVSPRQLGQDALSLGNKVKTVLLGSDLSKFNLNPFGFAYGNYVGGNRTNGLDRSQRKLSEDQIGGEGNPLPIDALDYGGLNHDQRFTRTTGSMRGAYDLLLIKDASLGMFGMGQGSSAPIIPSIMTITGMGIMTPFHAIGISSWRK